MEPHQITVAILLTVYGLAAIFSESCLGLIVRLALLSLLVLALNAGNFFA